MVYFLKPRKWIHVDKVLGIFFLPLHWIKSILKPADTPAAKTLITLTINKAIASISIVQALYIFLAALFNIIFFSFIAYLVIIIGVYIIEVYRLRNKV